MSINSNTSVEQLVKQGRYNDAAKLARDCGDLFKAADLYERIWNFAAAADCALEAGDFARALTNAIDARNEKLITDVAAKLIKQGDDGERRAMNVFASKRRFGRAAPLAEKLGEVDRAIDLYQQGHLDLDAARLLADQGKDREAGRLLERVIETTDPSRSQADAHLRLGLILAKRMRHPDAVRHLQEATNFPDTRDQARRALVVELAAMGLRDAARDVLIAARKDDPSLPISIDELIRSEREARPTKPRDDDVEIIGGRYRLGDLLGSGGAGRVFEARDEVSGRDVAIKLLSTGYAHGHEAFERFVREARVASALRHPNLVEVFEFSSDHGYIVMELMAGGSLADRIDGDLGNRGVQRMCLDVLGGLELAHQRGIIHRDVKPANIFFDARGTAKLGDFGVAHLLDLGATQTGGLIGTLAYMSPEQITGAPLTITADLYAIGITLFEALTKRLPFLGPDFVAQHLGEQAPIPTDIDDSVVEGWDPIIAHLLTKSPSDRFDTVDDLRRAVNALDLGERGQRPLMMPRAKSHTPDESNQSNPLPSVDKGLLKRATSDKREDAPRYEFETTLGKSENATLSRAVDAALDRTVIIERYEQPMQDTATEKRLYALARGGGPFLQRALSYDRVAGVAVFEAPAGSPLSEHEELSPRHIAKLLKRLARAVAPLHEKGRAHGRIDATTILLDDDQQPTVLTCGLGPVTTEATPEDDVAAIIRLIAKLIDAPESRDGIIDGLAPGLSHPERTAILVQDEPHTGEELYAFADAIEIALLKIERRNRSGSVG